MPLVMENKNFDKIRTILKVLLFIHRIAHMESSNRMNSNGLAIVFAPNIFRAPLQLSPQESLAHIPKQTMLVFRTCDSPAYYL